MSERGINFVKGIILSLDIFFHRRVLFKFKALSVLIKLFHLLSVCKYLKIFLSVISV